MIKEIHANAGLVEMLMIYLLKSSFEHFQQKLKTGDGLEVKPKIMQNMLQVTLHDVNTRTVGMFFFLTGILCSIV